MNPQLERITNTIGVGLLIAALTLTVSQRGCDWIPEPGPDPGPDPEPNPTVESPFPAEGYWLLLASESEDLSGVEVVANSVDIRKEPDLENRWHDYDQTLQEPWNRALEWAKDKSGRKPYFIARKGDKAAEGPLTGSADEMLEAVTSALDDIR